MLLALKPLQPSVANTLSASAGAFSLTGTADNFVTVLPAVSGSFVIAGSAANFALSLPASSGAFALAGSASNFAVSLAAVSGSFTYSGASNNFAVGMPAAAGAFTVSGSGAGLEKSYYLSSLAGALTETASADSFAITLPAVSGSFPITGTAPALLRFGYLGAISAAFSISGAAATLTEQSPGSAILSASAGAILITAPPAGLSTTAISSTSAGSAPGSGPGAPRRTNWNFSRRKPAKLEYRLPASAGSLKTAAPDAELRKSYQVSREALQFKLIGAADLAKSHRLRCTTSQLRFGVDASLLSPRRSLAAVASDLEVATHPAQLTIERFDWASYDNDFLLAA